MTFPYLPYFETRFLFASGELSKAEFEEKYVWLSELETAQNEGF